LFDRAKTAAGATLFTYFILSFFDILIRDGASSQISKTLGSLISTVAISRCISVMSIAEKSTGLRWANIFEEY